MIDTDKYEGHTPGPWDYDSEGQRVDINADDDLTYEVICSKVLTDADGSLIADAPLLLEEVKRLREIEEEWIVMWDALEELNLIVDIRKIMTLHGIVFPTDEDMEGEEE